MGSESSSGNQKIYIYYVHFVYIYTKKKVVNHRKTHTSESGAFRRTFSLTKRQDQSAKKRIKAKVKQKYTIKEIC